MTEKNIVEKKSELNYIVEENEDIIREHIDSEDIEGETFEESDDDMIKGIQKKPIEEKKPDKLEKPEEIKHGEIPPLEKKPKKQKMIDDILILSEKMGIQGETRNKLNKTTVGNLEKKLAELINMSLKNNLDEKLIKKDIEIKKDLQVKQQDVKINSIPDDLAGEALYNINFLMVNTIENITCSFDLPVNLEGLTKRMDTEKKEELKKILLRIVGDYGDVIKPLMSPFAIYMYTMLTLCQQTITDNLKKKSEK